MSFACGRFTGIGGWWGSNCSPINIIDELPSEMTKDEKVTGIPEPWCGSEGDASW
jgi:hypothetical protein